MSTAVRIASALRLLAFPLAAAGLALALLAAFSVSLPESDASHASGMDAMSVDMDITGNDATTLGPRDECIEVSAGDTVTIDVTATNIPISNPMIAFNFDLHYASPALSVASVDVAFLLDALPGSDLFSVGDPTPDSDGTTNVAVVDLATPTADETGSGVLARIEIDTSLAAPDVYALTLGSAFHIDQTNTANGPDNLLGAFLAVDASCDNLPTPPPPTPSPSPAPFTPTPSPGQAAVGIDHNGGSPDINPGPAFAPAGADVTIGLVTEPPAEGLGAWNIDVHYDPAVLSVVSCVPHGGLSVCNPAFSVVEVRVVGADATGIFSTFNLADITFEMIGGTGECSPILPEVNEYVNVASVDVPAGVHAGLVCNDDSIPTPPPPSPTSTPSPPNGGPAGGCPRGDDWHLAPIDAAIDDLDNGNFSDQNGDGFGCYRVNKGQTAKHGGIPSWTWKDNTNPLP